MVLGESIEDKRAETKEHYDRMEQILNSSPVALQPIAPQLTPFQRVETDIRDSNEHIQTALEELQKARDLSKCGVCRGALEETIDYVGEVTGEILDNSEKALAIRKLKDVGELPPDITWDELNPSDKKIVMQLVQQYHPLRPEAILSSAEEQEEQEEDAGVKRHGKTKTRKPATKRRQAPKRKTTRK